MLRASFFAAGLFVLLCGISLLFVDKLVLANLEDEPAEADVQGLLTTEPADEDNILDPPDWVAFSLMSVGSVTILYSVALPKKS